MGQIIVNWLILFILPFLAGMIIRFLARKSSKGWLVTVVVAVFIAVFVIMNLVIHSNIESFFFRMYPVAFVLIGSLTMGLILAIIKKSKRIEK